MSDITRKIQSLQGSQHTSQFQVGAIKTVFKTHQKKKNEQLHAALKGALDENYVSCFHTRNERKSEQPLKGSETGETARVPTGQV